MLMGGRLQTILGFHLGELAAVIEDFAGVFRVVAARYFGGELRCGEGDIACFRNGRRRRFFLLLFLGGVGLLGGRLRCGLANRLGGLWFILFFAAQEKVSARAATE